MTSRRTYQRATASLIGALLVVLVFAVPAYGQVTLAPTFVYVDSPARYGTVVLTNSTSRTQEVFIDFQFGYPAADSSGARYMEYDDHRAAAAHSLSPWIQSFPQRFRIAPKNRQLVRLMLQLPAEVPDGVYWTRMVVTSHEEVSRSAEEGSASVDFEFKQVIPVVFNNGSPTTSVDVADLKVIPFARHSNLITTLERDGDVPFFGSVTVRLFDESGSRVKEMTTSTEAYYRSSTYFTVDRDEVPAGSYRAEVTLRPERTDVHRGELPAMEPVTKRFPVEIPEFSPLTSSVE